MILRFIYLFSGISALIYALKLVKEGKTHFKEIILNDESVTFEFFFIYKNKIVVNLKNLTLVNKDGEILFKNISGDEIGIAKREFLINKEDWNLLLLSFNLEQNHLN